ncbi:hypothetical protein NEH40_13865, partial [Xanthomonas hortorum pv. pelargonii]
MGLPDGCLDPDQSVGAMTLWVMQRCEQELALTTAVRAVAVIAPAHRVRGATRCAWRKRRRGRSADACVRDGAGRERMAAGIEHLLDLGDL